MTMRGQAIFWKYKIAKEHVSVGGVMVSIDAFQALDLGSILGRRIQYFLPV